MKFDPINIFKRNSAPENPGAITIPGEESAISNRKDVKGVMGYGTVRVT